MMLKRGEVDLHTMVRHGISEAEAERLFIQDNIFTLNPQLKYVFQFEVTAVAAKKVIENSGS